MWSAIGNAITPLAC